MNALIFSRIVTEFITIKMHFLRQVTAIDIYLVTCQNLRWMASTAIWINTTTGSRDFENRYMRSNI